MKYRVVLESCIMQKGLPGTAGSKMLADFISPVNATVVDRLVSAGVDIVGRADTSEFGISGLFAGGVSGAASGAYEVVKWVADGKADIAFCNDFTGAISRVAADNGLFYIHPTYGSVSRYGLIPSVTSMDQIGVLCKNPEDGFTALGIITGYDSKDGVMVERVKYIQNDKGDIRVFDFVPKYSENCIQIMQILCCAEFGNNINRYDGIKFGYRAKEYKDLEELYIKSRTEAFGEDVKLTAMIGAMVLYGDNIERYYNKAMKMRRLIKDTFEFDKYDVVTSGCPMISRLCGFPSLTTPGGTYIAGSGQEDALERFFANSE